MGFGYGAALGVVAFGVACSDSAPPPPMFPPLDSGSPDRMVSVNQDTDDDGLCDLTEGQRNTNPFEADTDNDGFSDFFETNTGFDPTRNSSPEDEIVYLLREDDSSTVSIVHNVTVRGQGEDYTGAFETLPVDDLQGTQALDFYDGGQLLYAVPDGNVALMEPDRQAARGVVGETQLGFEMRFRYTEEMDRPCIRGYPFRYIVKRNDGRLVSSRRFLLVILPPGGRIGSEPWCRQREGCL
ncbi:MAG: hypothetical protein AAGF12_31380 [Myxococcota bacterium]